MKQICVRKEFTEEIVWRQVLGNSEPLLTHADKTDCLDAPDFIPAGSTRHIYKFTPAFRAVSTIVTREGN